MFLRLFRGSGSWMLSLRFEVQGLAFEVPWNLVLGLRVEGLGFKSPGVWEDINYSLLQQPGPKKFTNFLR